MRIVVRTSMALVALAAAALSYQSLMQLAELAQYGSLSVLYPLTVDAGAAASCAAWLHTRGRQPLVMTWALLATSVILNGTTHYLESTHTAPTWLLVVAVAAVPPTVLGLCVHLAVGMGRPDNRRAPRDSSVAGSTDTPEVWGGDPDTTDPVAELIAKGVGRRKLAAELGVTEHAARQLLAARNEAAS